MPEEKPLLATANSFKAVQVPGQVTLFAAGEKPTPRARVCFALNQLTVFPPEYLLVLTPADEIDVQIVAPFVAEVSFRASAAVETVAFYDSNGRHDVAVEHALDLYGNLPNE